MRMDEGRVRRKDANVSVSGSFIDKERKTTAFCLSVVLNISSLYGPLHAVCVYVRTPD